MTAVQHEYLAARGWVIPTPQRWPLTVFLAVSLLARLQPNTRHG